MNSTPRSAAQGAGPHDGTRPVEHNVLLPWDQFVHVMRGYSPGVYREIMKYAEQPFEAYAASIYDAPELEYGVETLRARSLLRSALCEYLIVTGGWSPNTSAEAADALLAQSALLTGPHLQLITEEEVFNAVVTEALAASRHRRRYVFWSANSMSRLGGAKKMGAGWARIDGNIINLFGLSTDELRRNSILCSRDRLSYAAGEHAGCSELVHEWSRVLARVSAGTACDWFRRANEAIWLDLVGSKDLVPVFLDDRFSALLLSHHLAEPGSIIGDLLFDEKNIQWQRRLIGEAMASEVGRVLPFGTEYFWCRVNNKLAPMRLCLSDLKLVSADMTHDVVVPWTPDAVASALRGGAIYPNVYLKFTALSILPCIRVNGGSRQVLYMPKLLEIWRTIFEGVIDCGVGLDHIHGLGSDILSNGTFPVWQMPSCGATPAIPAAIRQIRSAEKGLYEVARCFEVVRQEPIWGDLFGGAQSRFS